MTILLEMTKVMLAVPGPDATDDEVADWYEMKALLLEHIAAEGGPDSDQRRGQAELARRRSQRLRDDARVADVVPITVAGQRRALSGGAVSRTLRNQQQFVPAREAA